MKPPDYLCCLGSDASLNENLWVKALPKGRLEIGIESRFTSEATDFTPKDIKLLVDTLQMWLDEQKGA